MVSDGVRNIYFYRNRLGTMNLNVEEVLSAEEMIVLYFLRTSFGESRRAN